MKSEKKNQTGLHMKYFVLEPKAKSKTDMYAHASQQAMLAYAGVIQKRTNDCEFAQELKEWAREEHAIQVTFGEERQMLHEFRIKDKVSVISWGPELRDNWIITGFASNDTEARITRTDASNPSTTIVHLNMIRHANADKD